MEKLRPADYDFDVHGVLRGALRAAAGRGGSFPDRHGFTPQPFIHYARRDGWTWQEYPSDMQILLDRYKKQGAECVVLYFDRKTTAEERRRYDALLKTLPILEHRAGPWGLGKTPCEFYVLQLPGANFKAEHTAIKSQLKGTKN